jgi:hypothetical protein
VMRAALEEIDTHWNTHIIRLNPEEVDTLIDLMDTLGHRQSKLYPKFLSKESYEEYLGRLRIETDFARLPEEQEKEDVEE